MRKTCYSSLLLPLCLTALLIHGPVWADGTVAAQQPQVAQTLPTGLAISDLGDLSEQEQAARARTALIRGGLYGGDQPGPAQLPSVLLYMALSVFMGGVDAPSDLTQPADELR